MKRLFIPLVFLTCFLSVSAHATPGRTVINGPATPTTDRRPTITWTDVTGATWYHLWIGSGSANEVKRYHAEWIEGDTSWTPGWDMTADLYSVWVQTWGPGGFGPWSLTYEFERRDPPVVSSISGVVNDGGDIALRAGSNVTITPDNANNRITISATSSGEKGDKPAHQWSGSNLRFETPTGAWGPYVDLRGPAGPRGEPGGLRATVHTYPSHDFSTSASKYIDIPGLGSQVDSLKFVVHLVDPLTNVYYPLPGPGSSATSMYRVWWLRIGSNVSVRINRYSGPGEAYELRILAVPIHESP